MLRDNLVYLTSTLGVQAIHIYTASSGDAMPDPDVFASATPGKPQAHFFFDDEIKAPPAAPAAPPPSSEMEVEPVATKPTMMEYLEKHRVAAVLNDLVNEVATEQPADPFGALATKLAAIAKK